jgi:hypothetical protein
MDLHAVFLQLAEPLQPARQIVNCLKKIYQVCDELWLKRNAMLLDSGLGLSLVTNDVVAVLC